MGRYSYTGERADDPGAWAIITETAQARVGDILQGKYRLDGLLGLGGMAAVYHATDKNGERSAVKLLHPQLLEDDDIRKSFLREGFVANLIEHPGAVRVLDRDDPSDGPPYLVMELLEGETLQGRLRQRDRLPEEEALVITYRVLDVLAAAHARGILHQDIKPANVFITRDSGVKVLDFGIARLASEVSKVRMIRLDRKTTLGTPGFMAPERALGRSGEVDHQTDLWAVGATLFRLLTGRNVHEKVTLDEQVMSAATKPAPCLQSVLPQASPQLAEVVDRALAFTKADRWPDARHMQAAILPLLIGEGQDLPAVLPLDPLDGERARTPAPSPDARSSFPSTARVGSRGAAQRPLWWWPRALVLVGSIAAVALGGWLIVRDPPRTAARPEARVDTQRAPVRPSRVVVMPVPPPIPPASPSRQTPAAITPATPVTTPAPTPPSYRRSRARSQALSEEALLDRRH